MQKLVGVYHLALVKRLGQSSPESCGGGDSDEKQEHVAPLRNKAAGGGSVKRRRRRGPPVLSVCELQRQVALHVVRFVLDTVCFKWCDMEPQDMDENRKQCRHGLDRRSYARMEENVRAAVRAASWLISLPSHAR